LEYRRARERSSLGGWVRLDAVDVILAAHGAGNASEANRRIRELADVLRRRRPGVGFECAFWKGTPTYEEATRSLVGRSPLVVPIMASDGYYASRRLLEECAKGDPSRSFVITRPIGTLSAFPGLVATKVRAAIASLTGQGANPVVMLVGHGTTRVRSSGDAARWVREELVLAFPKTEVFVAFLDEPPRIAEVAELLGDRPVVVVPLLLGGGPHVLVDIKNALSAPRKILPPILEWPELAALVLDSIDLVTPRPMPVEAGSSKAP
jgi:sirohydrochlorin ferrochelatase